MFKPVEIKLSPNDNRKEVVISRDSSGVWWWIGLGTPDPDRKLDLDPELAAAEMFDLLDDGYELDKWLHRDNPIVEPYRRLLNRAPGNEIGMQWNLKQLLKCRLCPGSSHPVFESFWIAFDPFLKYTTRSHTTVHFEGKKYSTHALHSYWPECIPRAGYGRLVSRSTRFPAGIVSIVSKYQEMYQIHFRDVITAISAMEIGPDTWTAAARRLDPVSSEDSLQCHINAIEDECSIALHLKPSCWVFSGDIPLYTPDEP